MTTSPPPHPSSPSGLTDTNFAELAAVDLGSNSFRLEIGRIEHGKYRRTDYLKETVRLGGGLDDRNHLSEAAMARGLDCLARFAERLRGFPVQRVRAVATQTLREAQNRSEFLARAQAVLGHPIEVVSGREEARLIYAGVTQLLPRAAAQRLVIDIGGRSTEMILGRGRQPSLAESFRIGSVSLSMRHFPDGRFTEHAFRAAQIEAAAMLEEALQAFAPGNWQEAHGASGTVGGVAEVLQAHGVTDGSITPQGLRWCIEQCLRAGDVERLTLNGLKADRRTVIGGGLAILYTLAAQFGVQRLQPARGALRHGVLFALAGRADASTEDIRDVSVRSLQKRFGVDPAQARRVQALAGQLHRTICPDAPLLSLQELGWAAALHEIGMAVSHSEYHRHGSYLVLHADASGFSESQQRRLSDLVLGQRGGLRKLEAALPHDDFVWQVLCLRLAAILCHARTSPPPGVVRLTRMRDRALLEVRPDWGQAHPQTMYLLDQEGDDWAKVAGQSLPTLTVRLAPS